MPRYRFSWSNLPEGVVSALARFLDLDGPRHEIEASLRTEFGARPTPAFVKELGSACAMNGCVRTSVVVTRCVRTAGF